MSLSEKIVEYFAMRALQDLPDQKMRKQSAHDLKALYGHLKKKSEQRTLSASQRSVYGVTRLAGTFAVITEILEQFVQKNLISPTTILDCGSGPGTALFAAYDQFGEAAQYTGIEKDAGFVGIAERAVRDLLPHASSRFQFIHGNVPVEKLDHTFDLTIFSYMLSEIETTELEPLLHWALQHTKHYLVITDAGTPQVYRQLMAARRIIIEKGFTILAPCPHQFDCPMAAPNFCHFPARFTRHEEARRLKGATAQAEDEKYCYLIASAPQHHDVPFAENRIVARPLKRSGHSMLDVCARDGTTKRLTVSKKHATLYKKARDSSWGDEF